MSVNYTSEKAIENVSVVVVKSLTLPEEKRNVAAVVVTNGTLIN